QITQGRMADVVVLTPGRLTAEFTGKAQQIGGKDARIVITSIAPFDQGSIDLNLFNFAMFNQALLGTVFGSASPRNQVPRLLSLFEKGDLKIDEIITREYDLDGVQQGYEDLEHGLNVRGIVKISDG
ncbi:MAG: alcohol dehydrogenase, partial [Actinobacteria bacterium]|nr:alcohol dehydrogenase [Actinomycetota bacterium]